MGGWWMGGVSKVDSIRVWKLIAQAASFRELKRKKRKGYQVNRWSH